MPLLAQCRQADVNIAATGDNIVIPAVNGERLLIMGINLEIKGVTSLRFRDGVGGVFFNQVPYDFQAIGTFTQDYNSSPYWRTSRGGPFVIELQPGVVVTGRVYYLLG
jgi:hypothetical protein